ncbi:MAG: hypothetical protein KKA19_09295 [Candidatus Margulisbacteria bacterium]|nr:hypothetical protein [Candidatus Margulisiibacteriota bacterium]
MEILGLIDAIEATILDSPRLPFSDKIVIKEKKILEMLAKLRLVAQSGGEAAQRAVQGQSQHSGWDKPQRMRKPLSQKAMSQEAKMAEKVTVSPGAQKSIEVLVNEARAKAETMKSGADKYAKDILNQLLIITTKIQRTIENGKQRLIDVNQEEE